jgi:hypothetical protein
MTFNKQDLTNLYWLLTQYRAECDPLKHRDYDLAGLFNKIEKMWEKA